MIELLSCLSCTLLDFTLWTISDHLSFVKLHIPIELLMLLILHLCYSFVHIPIELLMLLIPSSLLFFRSSFLIFKEIFQAK